MYVSGIKCSEFFYVKQQLTNPDARWVCGVDDKCKKRMRDWKTAWIKDFPVICHLPKMWFLAAEMPESPTLLCVWLFAETHPQPFGADFRGAELCRRKRRRIWVKEYQNPI